MRVLVCGGRDFGLLTKLPDGTWEPEGEKQFLFGVGWLTERFTMYLPDPDNPNPEPLVIIEGGAPGADTIGADFAVVNWLSLEEHKADWNQHGKKAGPLRNIEMLEKGKPDIVVAFPGGRGTAHMVKIARAAGIPVEEVKYEVLD